jgi:hypothetical protein
MPGHIKPALQQLSVPAPTKPHHSTPHCPRPVYGVKMQMTAPIDERELLGPVERLTLQEFIGVLIYYTRAVDPTLLVSLGTLAAAQSLGTKSTAAACTQLLGYFATHPTAVIWFIASHMILHGYSDASYLSEGKARPRVGGHHYLSDLPTDPAKPPSVDDPPPPDNGAVPTVSNIMKKVLASAAEAKMGGFYNCQEAMTICTILDKMRYLQPPTPVQTDNYMAAGISNSTLKQRWSKAIDMRFYWVCNRVRQCHILIHWKRGATNQADYFTKHHPTLHHRQQHPRYLYEPNPAETS